MIWLLAFAVRAPHAVLQARAQAGFLALAAACFSIFLVRGGGCASPPVEINRGGSDGDRVDQPA